MFKKIRISILPAKLITRAPLALSAASLLWVIVEQQQLVLCVKLYCKCSSPTPGVKQLVQGSQAESFSTSFQRKTLLFNNLYSCVIVMLRALLALRYGC